MLLADGFEGAFIGISHRFGFDVPVATYDRETCIEILMRDDRTREEADEFFEYNVIGSWAWEEEWDEMPVFVETMSLAEATEWAMSV